MTYEAKKLVRNSLDKYNSSSNQEGLRQVVKDKIKRWNRLEKKHGIKPSTDFMEGARVFLRITEGGRTVTR
jgi:translation elongation factor EF-Tu-like GTPase